MYSVRDERIPRRAWPLAAAVTPAAGFMTGVGVFHLSQDVNESAVWDALPSIANTVLIGRHWQPAANPDGKTFVDSLADDVAQARRRGLRVYIGLEILSADRSHLELPPGWSGNFSDQRLGLAYLQVVISALMRYRPDVFIANVEVNLYEQYDPADFGRFVSWYRTAYLLAKQFSPSTRMAVSLACVDFNGRDCLDPRDMQVVKRHASYFEDSQDLLAISLYPACYGTPAAIPDTLLAQLAAMSRLPLFISETGWISEPFEIARGVTFPASEVSQAEYVRRLMTLAANVPADRLAGLTYIAAYDMDRALCQQLRESMPALGWYCSLGLMRADGSPKASFYRMQELRASRAGVGG